MRVQVASKGPQKFQCLESLLGGGARNAELIDVAQDCTSQ